MGKANEDDEEELPAQKQAHSRIPNKINKSMAPVLRQDSHVQSSHQADYSRVKTKHDQSLLPEIPKQTEP